MSEQLRDFESSCVSRIPKIPQRGCKTPPPFQGLTDPSPLLLPTMEINIAHRQTASCGIYVRYARFYSGRDVCTYTKLVKDSINN